ncbi:MAG: 2-oxoglutarate dehydrogenase complex dihydrolipoyllysine-residue succinyltransferase [Saprospirales bacterium]|nr:MAG: 2-oxoglutarate dehydrogenase complex dihydrolipoyllysine-residue succinyltransferase [Saprospirales bacterium]
MSKIEVKVPEVGESITEVTLSQWLVEDGKYVERDELICEFESDKATLELPAEEAGVIKHIASEGDDLEIGAVIAEIDKDAKAPAGKTDQPAEKEEMPEPKPEAAAEKEKPSSPEPEKSKKEAEETYAAGHPSPAAAKILRENDLDPAGVKGTGRDGRITKEDAIKAVDQAKEKGIEKPPAKEPSPEAAQTSAPQTSPAAPFSREERREKMSRMRRTIAGRLVSAKNETAMLTTFNEVDLSNVMAIRKKYQDRFVDKHGIKLGFMSLFSRACAKVLMDMPQVNARLEDDHLVYHDYVDISIAISTPNGLVVPPVKNVESLSLAEIELKIKELADKAREGKLTLKEMSGGTFTITNGGVFGSLVSTPILNEPQSAILGMHTIQQRPVAIDGKVEIRPMMYLALSYDHRVIDGSTSVTFLVKVKEALEDPVTLLLDI